MAIIKEIHKILKSLFGDCCSSSSQDDYVNDNYGNNNNYGPNYGTNYQAPPPPQNNYPPNNCPPPNNYPPNNYPPPPQNNYPPSGYPPNNLPPNNYGPNDNYYNETPQREPPAYLIPSNKKKPNKQNQKISYSQAAGGKPGKQGKTQQEKKKPQKINKPYDRHDELQYPSSTELNTLSKALQKILKIDENRFIPGKDVKINPQQSIRVGAQGDNASENLIVYLNKNKFNSSKTFKTFYNLLDNYNPELGVTESVTGKEEREIREFIDAICDTIVMKYAFNYLVQKSRIPDDMANFKKELYNIWFRGYYRKSSNDTSAFEHIFVGEIKEDNSGVIGFHNWITIYNEEKKGNFNYRGWIPPRRNAMSSEKPSQDSFALSIKFDWKGVEKPVSSCLIGTSPECEIALYTLLFYFSTKEEIEYEDYTIRFIMHTFDNRYGKTIGSCYPELI